MYRTNYLNLLKKLVPEYNASKILYEWLKEAKKKGEILSYSQFAKTFGLSLDQYQQILSIILIIRSDRQIRVLPENYKKIVAILNSEMPEFKDKKPNPFYGVLNDLYRHSNDPYTKSILNKTWTQIKSVAESSKAINKTAKKAVKVVKEDLLQPVIENVGSSFKLIGFLTNPYILLAGGGAFVYWRYFKK
jgi:hypothetical protein